MARKTYKDFIPPDTGKVYSITANPDGTSKISDVTKYLQKGDTWGAADANALWDAVEDVGGINATATYEGSTVKITAPGGATVVTFLAPSNWASGDSYTLNGAPLTLTDLNGNPVSNGWKTGSPIQFFVQGGKAFINHTNVPDTISPGKISAGTLGTGVVATVGTDYTTSRIRNIKFGTAELEDGVSPLESGTIYIQYSVE